MPSRGVVTLFGHGIRVCVDRGHLVLEDGIGERVRTRFPRVRHGLRRLVVIGSDGSVSLAAIRWLGDQGVGLSLLNRDGTVLATTGPVRPSDARLRRAQALAYQTGAAIEIARFLIDEKLKGQKEIARDIFHNSPAAEKISCARTAITTAPTIDAIRFFESQAALAYWNAWRFLPINFPKQDLHRVPNHWRHFDARVSSLTGSPRLATNPANAILNYLYAVLESETRLAVAALGLDPGLGVLHVDTQFRDSLAFDVMEPIRPKIDAYLLQWIRRETLKRDWFFEQRDGNCRLLGSFAVRLSKTAIAWAQAVAPVAERVAKMLSSTIEKPRRRWRQPTTLTQNNRREVKGSPPAAPILPQVPASFCRDCGVEMSRRRTRCATCANVVTTAGLVKAAKQGRIAAQSDQAQERRAETQHRHRSASAGWKDSDLPAWLDKEFYLRQIQPRLKGLTLSVLASTLDISIPYAVDIRSGRRVPDRRHWEVLSQLAGISPVNAVDDRARKHIKSPHQPHGCSRLPPTRELL
jgi:CRISPR-associated endonuclease Cas1